MSDSKQQHWELIVKLSKSETSNVYQMLLSEFQKLENTDKETTTNLKFDKDEIKNTSNLNIHCPADYIDPLFETIGLNAIVRNLLSEIDLSSFGDDHKRIEKLLMNEEGKKRGNQKKKGKNDVKTQVIEQSALRTLFLDIENLGKGNRDMLKHFYQERFQKKIYTWNFVKESNEDKNKNNNHSGSNNKGHDKEQQKKGRSSTTLKSSECKYQRQSRPKEILSFHFKTSVIELLLGYYCIQIYTTRKKGNLVNFFDMMFSLRECLEMLESCSPNFHVPKIVKFILEHYSHPNYFSWKEFIHNGTRFLMKNHFRNKYQKALKPFPEQKQLIREISFNFSSKNEHNSSPCVIFQPWGTGVGKTSMLPALSNFYAKLPRGFLTLYAIQNGPVQDQNAAYLYRCGTPFAFIERQKDPTRAQESPWVLRPSYMCAAITKTKSEQRTETREDISAHKKKSNKDVLTVEGTYPQVLIVEPEFVAYYLQYLKEVRDYELEIENGCSRVKSETIDHQNSNYISADHFDSTTFDKYHLKEPEFGASIVTENPKYAHLKNQKRLYLKDIAIILDEPHIDDPSIPKIIDHVEYAKAIHIMSATDCGFVENLLNEKKVQYAKGQENNESSGVRFIYVPAQSIGVSTTLVGHSHQSEKSTQRVLSPFHTERFSKERFCNVMKKCEEDVLWRRFLSSHVLLDLLNVFEYGTAEEAKKEEEEVKKHENANQIINQEDKQRDEFLMFDFMTIGHEQISLRVIELCRFFLENWELYEFPLAKKLGVDKNELCISLRKTLQENAHCYSGGCVLGVEDVHCCLQTLTENQIEKNSLSTRKRKGNEQDFQEHENREEQQLPIIEIGEFTRDQIEKIIDEQTKSIEKDTKAFRGNFKSKEEAFEAADARASVIENRMTSLPIPRHQIVNSKEHYLLYHFGDNKNEGPNHFQEILPMSIDYTTVTSESLDSFDIDKVNSEKSFRLIANSGAIDSVCSQYQDLRWRGVGGIVEPKEFYISNICDSNDGKIAFLVTDEIGAYGLNLKLRHAILYAESKDIQHEGTPTSADRLPISRAVCFQICGRVGRPGQDDSGYVHLSNSKFLEHMFST